MSQLTVDILAPGLADAAESWIEVICATDQVALTVLDTTDPGQAGLLPVVVETPAASGFADAEPDAIPVAIGPGEAAAAAVAVDGTLGEQILLWEHAVALAGRLLEINPFDWLPAGVATLGDALRALVAATPQHGYLAVQAYLDRLADASAAVLRGELARRTQRQTTFGWGPRFLHSTGQYHKGGHQNGAFLQLTGAIGTDIPVPGTGFTLGDLQRAQALGDADVLAAHGRPVLRLHLLDRPAGLMALVHAIQELR